jgi:hypothetical protein
VDVDPTVNRRTQAGIAIGGGVLLLILGAIAIWLVVKLGKGAGKVADDIADTATEITSGAKSTVQRVNRVGAVAGGLLTGEGGSDLNQDETKFSDTRDQLLVRVVRAKNQDKWKHVGLVPVRVKQTDVDLQVVNARTGAAVSYAVLHGKFSFGPSQVAQGKNVKNLVCDAQGYYRNLYWQIQDIPGTDKEDDLVVVAEKTGFNPSQPVTIG